MEKRNYYILEALKQSMPKEDAKRPTLEQIAVSSLDITFVSLMTSYSLFVVGRNRTAVHMSYLFWKPFLGEEICQLYRDAAISFSETMYPHLCREAVNSFNNGKRAMAAYLLPENPSKVD